MEMEIKLCNNKISDIWDDLVLSSECGTIFHTWKFLKIVENNTNSVLHPLMIYQGMHLKAIYPFFLMKKNGINIAMSPISRSFLYYLGPVFQDYENLKQYNKESRFIKVQQTVDDYLFSKLGCKYARIRLSPGLFDSRPLTWAGYNVKSLYTCRINLKREIEDIWKEFDKKLKVKIRKANENGVYIETGNRADLNYIFHSLAERLKSQKIDPIDPCGKWKFPSDIYDEFNDKNMKIFVAKHNEERIGGLISLYFKDVFYLWIGLVKNTDSKISANELIQWESIKWAKENGFDYYETMDSGEDPRLRFFKSKFNPDPVIWYSAEKYYSKYYRHIGELFRKNS